MSKGKATEQLDHSVKRLNTSTDYVFYEAYKSTQKIKKVSATKIGKRPIY